MKTKNTAASDIEDGDFIINNGMRYEVVNVERWDDKETIEFYCESVDDESSDSESTFFEVLPNDIIEMEDLS